MPTAKGWGAADVKRLTGPARGPATADGQPWKGV
jgi:hypothetical protein